MEQTFLGQESNLTDKTVLENGKHIPKVGEKDGKQESWPDQQFGKEKRKGTRGQEEDAMSFVKGK